MNGEAIYAITIDSPDLSKLIIKPVSLIRRSTNKLSIKGTK